jgi:hypothetical protein
MLVEIPVRNPQHVRGCGFHPFMPRLGSPRVGDLFSDLSLVPLLPCVHLLQHAFAAATVGDLGERHILQRSPTTSSQPFRKVLALRAVTVLYASRGVPDCNIHHHHHHHHQHMSAYNRSHRQLTCRTQISGATLTPNPIKANFTCGRLTLHSDWRLQQRAIA